VKEKQKGPPLKIERLGIGYSIDVKHCYLPFVVTDVCPTCGDEVALDLRSSHISYPNIGDGSWLYFYHYREDTGDEHEWSRRVVLDVTLVEEPA